MAPRTNDRTKPHQYRNLTFTDRRPKFLANIDAALRGARPDDQDSTKRRHRGDGDEEEQETEILDPSRPAIPVRPRDLNHNNADEDDDDEQPQVVDETDISGMGRLSDEEEEVDEDSPEVVVLKEGKHLTKEEFEAEKIRLRDHPDTPSTLPTSSRTSIKPSLTFSSNNKPSTSSIGKRKGPTIDDVEPNDSGWSDLVKRTKGEKPALVSTIKEERELAEKAKINKKQKKIELKAKNKKAKSLMSFS
ncbi:hypothetical protein MJO29_006217 [Puccinia striiformis f. sp. tritici]|uniref:DUF4604 domain-containing protein n=1 Tax=Puccinia striiformis f. sp. tritici PST-78 TaxID=1165861 RepID=A0A0L0VL31_9BASI|nr:hypothetical protein Pst134EB_012411 [Puccinia striiformis f. sp. tritici]KAI7958000.1 hypothetical protein MJO29_006217 [Puccinia striiformis f. sp. tritici]KAI9605026.1 hypothetical protein H4Q26_002997 [Puccinia striiformis f. sp. tritici PST-130]KNE99960.1 hypothetical protein PSTG_06812 [Puccinia striiformis f. sp. tritici PST-78]